MCVIFLFNRKEVDGLLVSAVQSESCWFKSQSWQGDVVVGALKEARNLQSLQGLTLLAVVCHSGSTLLSSKLQLSISEHCDCPCG